MDFQILIGVPQFAEFWDELSRRYDEDQLGNDEKKLFVKIVKAMKLLSKNPRHPGLSSHEIDALSRRCNQRVWQSYLENRKPSAGRLYWSYGPEKGEITIIGIEPHPEDKKRGGYKKVVLSDFPGDES